MTTDNTILKRLCGNIAADRFDWWKYCTPQPYFSWEILRNAVALLVWANRLLLPEVKYDWEMNRLTTDREKWREYLQGR